MKGLVVSLLLLAGIQFSHAVEISAIEQLIEQGQPQKALAEIATALQESQGNVALRTLQADALAASGKEQEAISQYQELIKEYPEKAELYNNLAILLSNQGNYEAARETLDKGLKTSETYAVIYDNLSNVYMEMARDSYGKALQLGVELQPLALRKLAVADQAAEVKPPLQANTVDASPVTLQLAQAEPVAAINIPEPEPAALPEIKSIEPLEVAGTELQSLKPQVAISSSVTAAAADVNSSKQDVIDSLQGWAAAWAAQASDLYLSFYHRNFNTPDGMSRTTWEAQRKQRLRRPQWIQIELDDMKVEMQDQDRAQVTLVQAYRSNGYQDKTRKQIVMANTSDGWRIVQEKSLGLVK